MNSLFLTSHLSWLKIWLLPISVENVGNTRARSMCSRPGRGAECWAEPCSVHGTAAGSAGRWAAMGPLLPEIASGPSD